MSGKNLIPEESCVNLPKDKAEEVLQLCLRDESVEMQTKVYEILSLSGIKTNDPMFLVLALTGQMRVLMETAPIELNQLLETWKAQTTESMTELSEAISRVEVDCIEQREIIQKSIEDIHLKGVNNIKAANQSLVAEILSINTEITIKAKELIEELTELHLEVKSDRKDNIKIMESLIRGIGKTYADLERINREIQSSISALQKVKVYRTKKWMTLTAIISAAFLIVFGSSIGYTILATQKSKSSSWINDNQNQLDLSKAYLRGA